MMISRRDRSDWKILCNIILPQRPLVFLDITRFSRFNLNTQVLKLMFAGHMLRS